VEVSTFLALSSLEEGPVCVICTRRSVEGGGSAFMGALMVSRPSEEREDVTESGLTSSIRRFFIYENISLIY